MSISDAQFFYARPFSADCRNRRARAAAALFFR